MFHFITRTALSLFILLFALTTYATTESANEEYPGRSKFRNTKYITLADLEKEYETSVIIDVRSNYEFETLHINKAINIPLFDYDFTTKLKKIRDENPTNKIITYCNGKTCLKSYKAVVKARKRGIKNIYAYDAGIFDWALANPSKTTLLKITPLETKNLIPKSTFNARLIAADKFLDAAFKADGIIVDTRDNQQREGVSLAFGREKRAPLHDTGKIDKVIKIALSKKKPLFIYDQTGKQVRWLMYYLEAKKVPEYYFMKGGIREYQKHMTTNYKREN